MKVFHLLILFVVLTSCRSISIPSDAITREIGNNNYVHFENRENNESFTENMDVLEQIVRETIEECRPVYAIEDLNIIISSRFLTSDSRLIPALGTGGEFLDMNTLEMVINMEFYDIETLLNENFKLLLLHEIGHVIHYRNRRSTYPFFKMKIREIGQRLNFKTNTNAFTLFEMIVSEGFADHFAIMIMDTEPQYWSINLDDEELIKYMVLAEDEFWNRDFDYFGWFQYMDRTSHIGYSLGYKIIGDYMEDHPEMSITEIMKLPDEEIYNSIEILHNS